MAKMYMVGVSAGRNKLRPLFYKGKGRKSQGTVTFTSKRVAEKMMEEQKEYHPHMKLKLMRVA